MITYAVRIFLRLCSTSVRELLIEEKENKGILITDHMYKNVTDISDTMYILSNGKTHLTQSPEDIETLGYARIHL
jgi:ABC-type lipopolysaccharide export system ATPase subunit